jgi:ERG2 and Sigma1 receptor like protein
MAQLFTIARYTVPLILIFALLDKYFLGKTYIFSPEKLQEICQESVARYSNDTNSLMGDIVLSLRHEYGEAVLPYEGNSWMLNNAGGAMVCYTRALDLTTGRDDDFARFFDRILNFLWDACRDGGTYWRAPRRRLFHYN